MYPSTERRFLAINYFTIISLFVLILAGGVVRSTGSGMGCPDWPKCFGRVVPPTDQAQLPEGYQKQFTEERIKKNLRFAKSLESLGFNETANRIRADESFLKPEEFNAAKTWTEYINRLIGAITGFLLLGCTIFSLPYLNTRKRIFFWSGINLLLVVFQAWLGSIVVSTNLLAWVVTLHMLVALAIVAISIYTFFQARVIRERSLLANQKAGFIRTITSIALFVTIIQVVLGTDVRERVDAVAQSMDNLNRSEWVQTVGLSFSLHRDLAVLVVLLNVILLVLIRRKYLGNSYQFKFVTYTVFLVVIQIILGFTLSYLGLPPVSQALHIVVACMVFGAQYYLLLLLKQNKLYKSR
ncbi:MAG: COX15/CtaA family protein [Pyrinomonadaceae bacterium]|nr:COX15/CtaA family protein [Sphingobacteriaceae bacterium]